MTTPAPKDQGRSGLRQLKTGEVLFEDGEVADSLFIIQKGQLRLYKPKGKGFVEIAVLRSGEVLGEMAFFDEDGSGRKRSATASAMVPTEVIEISFPAFGKTMAALNPWFKTIINTLATRLRKANSRIRELESNSATNYGNKMGEYEFMKSADLLRVLGTLFLVFKSHGERHELGLSVHKKTFDLYAGDIYSIPEAKLDAVLFILKHHGWVTILDDQDKLPNVYVVKSLETIRALFIFYNTEKQLADEKKLRISHGCELLFDKILQFSPQHPLRDIQNLRPRDEFDTSHRFTQYFNMTPVKADLVASNKSVSLEHLDDGRSVQITGDLVMEEGELLLEIDMPKLLRMYPIIKFVNAVNALNREKAGG